MTQNMDPSSSEEEFENEDSGSEGGNTDEELQEAFAAGLLKPGLNRIYQKGAERKYENDVQGMKQKLADLASTLGAKAPWIERLDLVSGQAPIAPELAMKEDQHAKKRQEEVKKDMTEGKKKKEKAKAMEKFSSFDIAEDSVHNDFKRELMFYRQAQSSVLEGLTRLKGLGVLTKRPQDYFAQMAKTDEHMQKVRHKLVEKQMTEERIEKIRKLREMKKFGKKVQIEVQQRREKEKRDMLEEVKKFRKGKIDSLDFLEDVKQGGGGKKNKGAKGKNEKSGSALAKAKIKSDKFGFGGKKRGMKRNTKESADNITGYKTPRRPGVKISGNKNKKTKRPGKSKRQKMGGGKRK